MTIHQFPRARILNAQTGSVYAVDLDTKQVYQAKKAGSGEDYRLERGERPCEAQGGELRSDAMVHDPELRTQVLRAASDIRASKPLMTPGVKHFNDSDWVSGGVIPKREWRALQAGERLPAFRPSRSTHMELFDINRNGWVTLSEQAKVWPALGTHRLAAPVKAAITAVIFGNKNPLSGRFLQINTDEMLKPKGRSGLFREDGTVNKEVADKVRAVFTPAGDLAAAEKAGRAPVLVDGTWIGEADFGRIVNEAAGRIVKGVSRAQWRTTFDVVAVLNQRGERKMNLEQLERFLEGSLSDLAISYADPSTGAAPSNRIYRNVMEESARIKADFAEGARLLPAQYIQRQLKTYRPELELSTGGGEPVPAAADAVPTSPALQKA